MRHLLEVRMGGAAKGSGDAQHCWNGCGGNRGKREFIQVLRLLEALALDVVTFAITEAVRLGATSFDAVKLIALARIEHRPVRLDLAAYPHLPRPAVRTTSPAAYAVLLAGMAA